MKADNETNRAAVSQFSRLNAGTAPSLRVPVTAGNRDFLRWLRAAEMSAWEAGEVWHGESCPAECLSANHPHN